MASRWRWILIVAVATALDLLARFGTAFDFARVMHVEALLFPITALVLAALRRSEPRMSGWPHAVRVGVVWCFALAGLRPLLWTLGLPLMVANLASVVVLAGGILRWGLRRRARRRIERARAVVAHSGA
jgi:hypothetical protein